MKKTILNISCILMVGFAGAQTVTPTVYSSNGGFASNANGSIAWTIGEPLSNMSTASNNILTQGFHQPQLELVNFVSEGIEGAGEVLVYPNPVKELLEISFKGMENGVYKIRLNDAAGKKIFDSEKNIDEHSGILQIKVDQVASGVYFLTVNREKFHTTIKINKVY